MPDRKRTRGTLVVSAALLAPSVLIAQDEESFDRTPVECVATISIDHTDIIDDQTIIFFMRGKRIFRNYSAAQMPGSGACRIGSPTGRRTVVCATSIRSPSLSNLARD